MKLHSSLARRIAPAALLALTAALLSGCGTVDGTAVAGEIDIRKLDIGSYPTDPLDYRAEYHHDEAWAPDLAVMRLSDHVANGWEIDPSLKFGRKTKAITYADVVSYVLGAADVPVVQRNNMLFGFSMSAASTGPDTHDFSLQSDVNEYEDNKTSSGTVAVNLTVLQFPDADQARTAATELEAADFGVAAQANAPVAIDGFPDAKAHWRPGIPTLGAVVAHGDYVVNVFVKRPDADLAALQLLAHKAFATQLPMLDQLPPLSARDVLHLDYDPQLMFRRTLHPDDYAYAVYDTEYVLTPRGFLHKAADTEIWRHVFDIGGIDSVATVTKGGMLLRARDDTAAKAVVADFRGRAAKIVDAPPGVPDAYCNEYPTTATSDANGRFGCMVRYDRYVGRVFSAQLQDAQQRAAAQYALLTKSKWM